MAVDELDERLIALLQENARATFAELGKAVGLSAPAVKRRVDRMRATGVIRRFTVTVDPVVQGWTTEAYVELFCRARTTPADVFALAARYPQVRSACTISGDADALFHVRASGVRDFERILELISADPIVVRTKSVIVLSRAEDDAVRPAGAAPRS